MFRRIFCRTINSLNYEFSFSNPRFPHYAESRRFCTALNYETLNGKYLNTTQCSGFITSIPLSNNTYYTNIVCAIVTLATQHHTTSKQCSTSPVYVRPARLWEHSTCDNCVYRRNRSSCINRNTLTRHIQTVHGN